MDSVYEWMEQMGLVDTVLLSLAAIGPLLCAAGFLLMKRHPVLGARPELWVLSGVAAPALYLLWIVYNMVIERWGLDNVFALGVNALIFLTAAVLAVLLERFVIRLTRAVPASPSGSETPSPSSRPPLQSD